MKKFLSAFLAFLVAVTFIGTHSLVDVKAVAAPEEGDATLYIHVFQFDEDYTNTGLGIWDGVDWNSWADVSTSTDDFGAVIAKTFSATKLADANLLSSIEVKPTSNVTVDDSSYYLAPGEGKVFADISDLIDGSETEIHLYYVEGDTEFMRLEYAMGTVAVYMDPAITVDPLTYDNWGIHSWDRGTGVPAIEWSAALPFTNDVLVTAGDYDVPMKATMIPVGSDALDSMGFIVHNGDSKAYPNDLSIPKATDGNVNIVFYIRGMDATTTDPSVFLANAAVEYEAGLVNRFMGGTIVTGPETVTVEMFQPKTPFAIYDRLWIEDADEAIVAVTGYDFGDVLALGEFTSAVTIASETHVTFYMQLADDADVTDVLNDYVAVGSFQGWSPENGVAPLATYADGANTWLVFEFTTFDSSVDFKVLFAGADDLATTEVDESTTFAWGDPEAGAVAGGNISIAFNGASSVTYKFNADTEVLTSDLNSGDATLYTYTPVTATNNLLTVFLPLNAALLVEGDTFDVNNVVMVGSLQGWSPENGIHPTEILTVGLDQIAVFQVDTVDVSGEYKALYIGADNVETAEVDESTTFAWGDPELITANTPFNFGLETALVQDLGGEGLTISGFGYVDTVTVENVFWLSVYMENNYEGFNVGLVGAVNGWDIANPILPSTDVFGNLYFDLAVSSRTGEFKIFVDKNEDGFDWGDAVTGNDNVAYDLGTANQGVLYFAEDETNVFVKQVIGEDLSGIVTKNVTLTFAEDTFAEIANIYNVYFVETEATETIPEFVIEYVLDYATGNGFVVPADFSDYNASYALTPTHVEVLLSHAVTSMSTFDILDDTGASVAISAVTALYEVGTYVPTLTPAAGEHLVLVTIYTERTYTSLSQFGIVGSVQAWNGTDYTGGQWDINNTIAPIGVDSLGNIVFELLLGDTTDTKEFKVVFDPEADGFAWDGNECTPANVVVTPTADVELFFVDGQALPGNANFTVTLTNALDPLHTYTLVMVDEKGFTVSADLFVDNAAPDAYFTVLPGVEFEIEKNAEFDIMDFYSIFGFVDARDGQITYVVEEALDTSVIGSQDFVVSATDTYGNTVTETINFVVIDTVDPILGVNGQVTFEVGSEEPTWAYYAKTNEGTIEIDLSQVDMDTVGVFYVRWTATDESGNVSSESLMITIVDTVAPVLTVSGTQEFTVGDALPTWATYATTNEGTVTVDSSDVDFTAAGTYTVTWTATDASGNASSASLDITVNAVEEVPATGCTWFNAISLVSFTLVAVLAFVVVRKRF